METQETKASTGIVPAETKQALSKIVSSKEISVFNTQAMDALYNLARKISASNLIPDHYQNNPSNCFLAMWKSERMGMDFHSFMQVSYVLKGKFGYEAKFVIARLNTSGKFKGPIRWKADGEIKYKKRTSTIRVRDKNSRNPNDYREIKKESLFVTIDSTRSWTAFATLKDCGEQIEQTFYLKTAVLNGWIEDPTSKWNTMTEEKGQYQSAVFLGRMYAPEVIMDMQTKEELEDIRDAEFVNESETGRDIFEKGEPIDTTPEPVLDPAKERKQDAAAQASDQEGLGGPQEVTVISRVSAPVSSPEPSTIQIFESPPTGSKFWEWFSAKFKGEEATTVDKFLISKKWIQPGETAACMSESKIKNLRTQWDRFLVAYNRFKKGTEEAA